MVVVVVVGEVDPPVDGAAVVVGDVDPPWMGPGLLLRMWVRPSSSRRGG